ncbi:MAG: hydroxylamine reductase, partial [Deltaproteobacteria bacterium]|nr:hydroxylamine reductase [Deltaproteobacteria bacterium]
GVCGKKEDTSNLQDLLVHICKGVAVAAEAKNVSGGDLITNGRFITKSLFATITNANFDSNAIISFIRNGIKLRDELSKGHSDQPDGVTWPDCVTWTDIESNWESKGAAIGVLSTENEDVRSLRELLVYGLKGVAAYAHHAELLGKEDPEIYKFFIKAIASTTKNLSVDEMVGLVLEAGKISATTMALLDSANTSVYGNPEITEVNIGVDKNPGILISGHDLKDMEQLLKQTDGTGVDVYTHSEMLPAHYYPEFKKYKHLKGNYGGAWYTQKDEFESFNGPIVMTTNCIVPPKDSYKNRMYTTGVAGFDGLKRVTENGDGTKDFTKIIEQAKQCQAPVEIETGSITGGFAHNQVLALADKVVDAVKSGAIKKFVVMAGCDGRQKEREYFTDVAKQLPSDTVILTAGCAKFRYNKLNLGDIGGIPRVLDAGQCNDSYSLAVIALKLKEVFELEDVNDLPLDFDIAWYEQKAVAVLLALLHLGFKGVRLGPTLPAFLSPDVTKVLIDAFDIKGTTDAPTDVAAIMG